MSPNKALQELDRAQPNLATKPLRTGWVMMSTPIKGTFLHISLTTQCWFVAVSLKYNCLLPSILSGGGYSGNQENRYVGFGNTVSPEKKEDDFINNAMSSLYSVGHKFYISHAFLCISIFLFFSHVTLVFLRVGTVLLLELQSLLLLQKTT